MARPPMKIGHRVLAEIQERTARGESAATIKGAVRGAPSEATIERLQRKLRGKAPASPSREPVLVPAPAPPKLDLFPLNRAYERAADDREAARRLLDIVTANEPEIGAALAAGMSLVAALADSDHGDALSTIREPRDVADFVRQVTRDHAPLGYELEPGETKEDFERFMKSVRKAERERAIELLEAALAIVKEQ